MPFDACAVSRSLEGVAALDEKVSHLLHALIRAGRRESADEVGGPLLGKRINERTGAIFREVFAVYLVFVGEGDSPAKEIGQSVFFSNFEAATNAGVFRLHPG